MLLVTGGSGFVGRAVLARLAQSGYAVRILLEPSNVSPDLPRGVPAEVAVTSLGDPRGVRAALVGVEAVIHLSGAVSPGSRLQQQTKDVEGTSNLAQASARAGVRHLLYLSHLAADRASAYPLMRAKASAEEHVRASGVPFTILRSAVAYGAGDHFTTGLAKLLAVAPFVFPLPGDGSVLLQPLWIGDLATSIVWALDNAGTIDRMLEIGGPEFLSLREIVIMVMRATGRRRLLVKARTPYLRALAWLTERIFPRPPLTTGWLDYLAVNRTASLDTLPSVFGIQPARMEGSLEHLQAGKRQRKRSRG